MFNIKEAVFVFLLISSVANCLEEKRKGTPKSAVELIEDSFGFIENKVTGKQNPVRSFTWINSDKTSVTVINYGATIVNMKVPDRKGNIEDVVMGYDNIQGYQEPNNPYFGATIGRICNRIGNATFVLDGKVYTVARNLGNHQLHGGIVGFDKAVWDYYIEGTKVVMSHLSPDGDQGYPGAVITTVIFELLPNNNFVVEMKGTSTKRTPISLTNHGYFNLAGHAAGKKELLKHEVQINADRITVTDENSIPTGEFMQVAGTNYDLQVPKKLEDVLDDDSGYDNNFCVNRGTEQDIGFVARVSHPPSGRVLEVYSNQPGVQFYTSNSIPDKDDYEESSEESDESKETKPSNKIIVGKNKTVYEKHGALCLETQNYPEAINHPNFPNSILNPGKIYDHKVIYKFWVQK